MQTIGGDLPILYLLMGILIFLALVAALGTWMRGGGLKREDAEELFNSAQERNREELQRIEKALEETRLASATAQSKQQADMTSRLQELESIVAKVSREHGDTLSSGMESVSRLIESSERRTGQQVDTVLSNIGNLDSQVRKAGEQVAATLGELMRQQRDQKAQSTIQLCEALITSLGTLKSSIANQITEGDPKRTIDSEDISEPEREYVLPAAAPSQWPSTSSERESEAENTDFTGVGTDFSTSATSNESEFTLDESPEKQTEPATNLWNSPFGNDVDNHSDEEEYPLPADAGPGSLFATRPFAEETGDAKDDAISVDQTDETKPDEDDKRF